MKKIEVTYKDVKRMSDIFLCDNWCITDRNCLLKFYLIGHCIAFVRLTEVLKVEITNE